MRQLMMIILITCACNHLHAQGNIITTICGQDTAGYCGDGGPASGAALHLPEFLRLDKENNLYIGDCINNRIRKIDGGTGVITTIAGDGTANYNGDNIAATAAELYIPEAVCVDSIGNVYIADDGNNRVRKITASTGIITTVAGSGPSTFFGGYSGDGGLATDAQLSQPCGLSVDRHGNIYIGDYSNDVVRRVDASTGIITTFAGKQGPADFTGWQVGYSGDGGPATNAVLSGPIQVFCDSADNVLICDQYNNAIRKVDIKTGIITTVVGNGVPGIGGNGGPANAAQLSEPYSIFIDKQNNLFIVDGIGTTIRKVDARTNIISVVAGKDTTGFSGDGGPATNATLNCGDVSVDDYGTMYITDSYNERIRKVYNPKLSVSTVNADAVVSVYPNPIQDKLTVSYHFNADGVMRMMDIAGHLVAIENLSASKQEDIFDVNSLPPGMYLYRVLQKDIPVSTGKLIKQ